MCIDQGLFEEAFEIYKKVDNHSTLALYRTLTRLPHRYYDVVGVDYKEYLLLVRSSSYRSENEK